MSLFDLQICESLPSSNNVVKHAIEQGRPEGMVVCTYEQTAGYGRLGRSWVSPFGGLYFSMLLRPDTPLIVLPTLGLLVARTIQQTVQAAVASDVRTRVQIKWPNDVVLAPDPARSEHWRGTFDKLCGISFERHAGGLCVGVGLNVFHPYQEKQVGGKNTPVYVADLMGERLGEADLSAHVGSEGLTPLQRGVIDRLCRMFLDTFETSYLQWQSEGFAPFLDDYAENLCLRGMRVEVVNQVEERMTAGVVQGVDDQARLVLLTDFGTLETVTSGEVQLVRPVV